MLQPAALFLHSSHACAALACFSSALLPYGHVTFSWTYIMYRAVVTSRALYTSQPPTYTRTRMLFTAVGCPVRRTSRGRLDKAKGGQSLMLWQP